MNTSFPKIKSFKHVCKYVDSDTDFLGEQKLSAEPIGVVSYRGTVKLHGTNAGVRCSAEGLTPQSRNRALSLESDNYGFARFVLDHEDEIRQVESLLRDRYKLGKAGEVILYGELIGKGIQQAVAITRLESRHWVLFGAAFSESTSETMMTWLDLYEIDYGTISWPVDAPSSSSPPNPVDVMGLDFNFTVDFESLASRSEFFDYSAEQVRMIDEMCPYGRLYGLTGPGEGLVWVPIGEHRDEVDLWFKHKGGRHKDSIRKIHGSKDSAEAISKRESLVSSLLEARLEEGIGYLEEMGLPLDRTSIPEFLKRVAGEVKSECNLEIQEAGFEWRDVGKTVTAMSVKWYKRRIEE